MSLEMTPNRPYLLRALYDWISDNSMTPHILVDADHPGVEVPDQAGQKGKVSLNIDQAAGHQLELGNDLVSFNARFSGQRYLVQVPVDAVLAIYSKENGQGMMFAQDDEPDPTDGPDGDEKPKMKRPHLRVVK